MPCKIFTRPLTYYLDPVKMMYTARKINMWQSEKSLVQLVTQSHKVTCFTHTRIYVSYDSYVNKIHIFIKLNTEYISGWKLVLLSTTMYVECHDILA